MTTHRPDQRSQRSARRRPRTRLPGASRRTSIALAAGGVYVLLRVAAIESGPALVLSLLLLATELWSLAELALLRHGISPRSPSLGRARTVDASSEHPAPVTGPVDVVINASGATGSMVERTLLGATALARRGRVIVIDGERRDVITAALRPFPVTYRVDPTVTASPLKAVRAAGSTEAVLWLDAGQVPMPKAIDRLLRPLADPAVAVVQSSIEPLNAESLVHLRGGRDDDALLRAATGPGRGRRGVAPWHGSGALLRTAAVVAHRPVDDDTDEDIDDDRGEAEVGRALVAIHRAGWQTRYDDGGLIKAAAAESLSQYLDRRRRRAARTWAWFLGRTDNPIWSRRLTARHRLSYLLELEPHLRGVRYLTQTLIVVASLWFGVLPIPATTAVVGAWLMASISGAVARRALSAGSMAFGDWIRHGWRTVEADLRALGRCLAVRVGHHPIRDLGPTEARGGGLGELGNLRLLTAVVLAIDIALIVRSLSLIGNRPLAAMGALDQVLLSLAALGALAPMIDVLQVVVLGRQRRAQHRRRTRCPIVVFGIEAETVDLSPAGIGVVMDTAPEPGRRTPFAVRLRDADGPIALVDGEAVVRSISATDDGRWRVGLEFVALDSSARLTIMAHCVLGRDAMEAVEQGAIAATLDVARTPARRRGLQTATALGVAAAASLVVQPPVSAMVDDGAATADRIAVAVLGTDGAPVMAASVRYHDGRWQEATVDEGGWSAPADGVGAIDIVVDDQRLVIPDPEAQVTVRLSRLVADGALDVVAVNRGGHWLAVPADGRVVPGRMAVRLDDGTVVKIDVPEAVEVSLPGGEQRTLD